MQSWMCAILRPVCPTWIAGTLGLMVLSGCASSLRSWMPTQVGGNWIVRYDTAERRARETGRELLIVYRDPESPDDTALRRALRHREVQGKTASYVRCMLFKTYEPDRRYVAQFHIYRAPAVIVVHPDGTYHAQSGPMVREDVLSFLAGAEAPGKEPDCNPYVWRRAEYDWHDSFDEAKAESQKTGRPILVACYRLISADWPRLERILSRHEVYSRLAGMIPCRIHYLDLFSKTQSTPFGRLDVPALVIVQADGTYDALEVPDSYEAVVRFADTVRERHGTTTASLDCLKP